MKSRKSPPPIVLTSRDQDILRMIYYYRFVTALDVTQAYYAHASLPFVRSRLSALAGGDDFQNNQYLYRFCLPQTKKGNMERIFTLGSRGRDFLSQEVGLHVNWHYRPEKVRHLSYAQIAHSLLLTRFLIAAQRWSKDHPEYNLAKTRISYELAQEQKDKKAVPDGWMLFERKAGGKSAVLLEIDRGMEFQAKFKEHVRSRIKLIQNGDYAKWFDVPGVIIAYTTTGQTEEYQESRRKTMCKWTQEVLVEENKRGWAGIFRFSGLDLKSLYTSSLFDGKVWYRPDQSKPVSLLD
jgi:hypothetical protein